MSDAIGKTGCVRHRADSNYFILWEDFQDIATEEHKKKVAAYLRVLEVKTTKKKETNAAIIEDCVKRGLPFPEINLWLEISYNDFEFMTQGVVKRSSFQIADKECERLLFSKSRIRQRRQNPKDHNSKLIDYKEYLLVVENVQAAIDGKPLPITGEDFTKYGQEEDPHAEKNMGYYLRRKIAQKAIYPDVEKNMEGILLSTAPHFENNWNINNITESNLQSNINIASEDAQKNKKTLGDFSNEELQAEIARRNAQGASQAHRPQQSSVQTKGEEEVQSSKQAPTKQPSLLVPEGEEIPIANTDTSKSPRKAGRPPLSEAEKAARLAAKEAEKAQKAKEREEKRAQRQAEKKTNERPKPVKIAPERTERFLDVVDRAMTRVMQETNCLPAGIPYRVLRDTKNKKAVNSLIETEAYPIILARVIHDMWLEESQPGFFYWRQRGFMTIPAICRQYSLRAVEYVGYLRLVTDENGKEHYVLDIPKDHKKNEPKQPISIQNRRQAQAPQRQESKYDNKLREIARRQAQAIDDEDDDEEYEESFAKVAQGGGD